MCIMLGTYWFQRKRLISDQQKNHLQFKYFEIISLDYGLNVPFNYEKRFYFDITNSSNSDEC